MPVMAQSVHFTNSGRPISSIGKPSSYRPPVRTRIISVQHNISGKPVNSVGRPTTSIKSTRYKTVKNYSNPTLTHFIDGKPNTNNNMTTFFPKHTVIVHDRPRRRPPIGQPKPPRIMASRCAGITYYDNGVARCGSSR